MCSNWGCPLASTRMYTCVAMSTHRETAINIFCLRLYATTYLYWHVKCFSYVKSKVMLFDVICCRCIEKNPLQCALGLWTLLCPENFWYSTQALHFLRNFQHAQPCTLFQRLWYYPEAITKEKKTRNYLSSSYLFRVLEKRLTTNWQLLQSTFS